MGLLILGCQIWELPRRFLESRQAVKLVVRLFCGNAIMSWFYVRRDF